MGLLLLPILIIAVGAALGDNSSVTQGVLEAPRAPKDRFRLIISNVNEERVLDEIADFTNYRCEKMVVVRNRAHEDLHLSCNSHDAASKTITVKPGNAFLFSFRPKKSGVTNYWCTVEYQQQFARFDVYHEGQSYMCPRSIDEVYQYTVTHDGVHVGGDNGDGGTKIRALFKGHNKFILWEEFVSNVTDGFLYSGLVDGGMCSDIPAQFNDKPAAITVCYNHCVHLYEHFGCRGETQTVQASNVCVDVALSDNLNGKLSAIKGC